MKRKGYLQSRRQGRYSFYRLTDRGLRQVRWGGDRAFAPPDDEWDARWTVVVYSVPEECRECRDALRRSLNWWGFGALAPGTWISPRPLPPQAEGKWRELGAWEYVEVFRAEHLGPSDPGSLVAHAWPQLPALGDRYRAYVVRYEPILRRFKAGVLDDEDCFACRLRSLFEFVAITLDDVALPFRFLPEDWPRPAAQRLFEELRQSLAAPAERFFETIRRTTG
jgi:phenylacetic acid degradation operon negative regulatory protein